MEHKQNRQSFCPHGVCLHPGGKKMNKNINKINLGFIQDPEIDYILQFLETASF